MTKIENEEQAIDLPAQINKGQVAKGGKTYIEPPKRIMEDAAATRLPMDYRILAALHDVIEDCDVSYDDLRERGVTKSVFFPLRAISRVEGEKYADYIKRVKKSRMARVVKILDLRDNLSPERQGNLSKQEQRGLGKRYNMSLAYLEGGYEVF